MPLKSYCLPNDPEDPARVRSAERFGMDHRLPWPLALCLALQQVLVQSSLLVLVVGLLQGQLRLQEGEEERILASGFFHSAVSSLLQGWLGTRLPLLQSPSLEFVVPALVLTHQPAVHMPHNWTEAVCRGACMTGDRSFAQADPLRELQGMVLTSGLVLLALGASGLSGLILQRLGPLVLAPLLCVLGFSIYREAAVLCSEHWGVATLAVLLMVLLSQHLHSWSLPTMLGSARYPIFRMVSVLLPMLGMWGFCAILEHLGYFHPRSTTELLSTLHSPNYSTSFMWASLTPSSTFKWINLNTSTGPLWISHNASHNAPWFSFPLTGELRLPLLSTRTVAAGVAVALSSFISSLGVYLLTARLLRISFPPPHACNRGLCAEGFGAVIAALLGAPLGVSSSVPNACTLGLSQCGCPRSFQLAATMGLILGVSPQLTQLLTSFPLGLYGAVLSVTYTIAAGTGVTYFQYTHMDSGRNIFNIGFAIFMSLLLPHWFNLHPSFIRTGAFSLDVLLQSLMTLPVFLVGLLAFFLDNTVSGSLSERGLSSSAMKKWTLGDSVSERSQDPCRIYNLPGPVQRLLELPGIRVIPFCACRTQTSTDVAGASQESSDLLNGVVENQNQNL